jgi:hypothetical protein
MHSLERITVPRLPYARHSVRSVQPGPQSPFKRSVTGVKFRPEPLRGWHLAVCETSRAMPDHQVERSRRGNTRVAVLKLEVNSTEVLTRPSAREGIRAMLRAPIRLPQCARAQTCWLHSRLYLSTCRFQRRDQTLHPNPQGRYSYHRFFSKKTGLLTPGRSKTLKKHFTLNYKRQAVQQVYNRL